MAYVPLGQTQRKQTEMTPKEIAAAIETLKGTELSKMSHANLYLARDYVPAEYQNKISPYEHRAFAREATQENPWMALPIAAGTVAYQPYKILKGQSRSGASLDQVVQGMAGVGEGLWGAFQDQMSAIQSRIEGKDMPTLATGLYESLRDYLPSSSKANTLRR